MKIFLIHEQASVTSPMLMTEAFQAIKQLPVPEECQEFHDDFVDNFTRLTVDQLNEKVSDIVEESEVYASSLADIMKSLKTSTSAQIPPKIIQETVQDQYLKEFEGHFGQYRAFKMAKEALYKQEALAASQPIRALIGEIADDHPLEQQFIAMYSSIIKALPDFQIALSDEQVFSAFAPIQLKNTLSELFKQLQKQTRPAPQKRANVGDLQEDVTRSSQQDGAPSKIISDLLGEIFIEDAKFNEMLCRYLTESSVYAEVVRAASSQIKTLKRLRQEHSEKASSQITQEARSEQNIADFMTVDIDMDLQALQKSLGGWFLNSKKIPGKSTTLVLYDLIKKRCNFENFITLLSQNSASASDEMLFTQQFLLSYLLNNSDTYLRTMILTTCSYFMPLPLVSYQPKRRKNIPRQLNYKGSKSGGENMMALQKSDQDIAAASEKQLEFVPFVFEELFYCFEKYMAVLAFKVSANPNKSPQGCTSLTNFVFNRTFQTHSKSFVNYGSIEIQFDYNFEHPMLVPVADAHGLVEDGILERVYPLFDIFMIHSFSGNEHQEVAQKQITKIRSAIKNPLIFLIIHDENRKENDFTSSLKGNIVQISLGRYNDLLGISRAKLRTLIVQNFLKHIGDYKGYEADIPARLKSLKEFSDFAARFRAYRDQFIGMDEEMQEAQGGSQEALGIIRNFMKLIDENKEHLRSDKVLTLNVLFEEACRLEKTLFRDTSLKSDDCEKFRLRVDKLYKAMRDSQPRPLTQELMKIIEHQNYLGLTSIISKFIRSFLNLHLKPLLKERETLRTNIQKPNLGESAKDKMFARIAEITKTLEQRYYSNEFLYREYYISELSKHKGSEKLPSQSFIDYLTLCKLQISQGQPFEIIDGNNLQFIKEVYQRIQDDRRQDEEILVVSVIGPQSSGKSLLLNTLFGAQFLSSAGRCTRGVYGCLIDIKCNVGDTRFKKILVLDTEGIQSTEAIDEAFDKRVVFYILCVSHVVLICNKGEMNKNMEDTIKLSTDCIMQVKEKIDMQPQVNVIMNNVQINENSLYQTIQSLSNAILEMKRHEAQRQIFTIDESNVFLLPNAFAQSGNEGFVANQPSYQFAEKVDQLRQRILNFMQSSDEGHIASYTLESWFKFAQAFWEFTDGYSGLTEYSTLEERKEDILLVEFTKKLISKHFEDPSMIQKHEQIIQQEVAKVLSQHQGFDQTNINVIKKKIDVALHPGQQEVEMKIYDEFRAFTDDKGIRPQIKKRRQEQLETQTRQHFFNWQQIVQKLLGEFNETKSKFIGDKSLQNAIDGYIQADHGQFTGKDAGVLFETEWAKIENQTKSQLKQKDQVSEEQFLDIGQNLYRPNARKMIKVDQDRSLLNSYQGLESRVILNHLRSQQSFFYYNSNTIKPKSEVFKQLIEREKHFINIKDLQFFDENTAQRYYDWKRVVQERFIFDELSGVLKEEMGPKQFLIFGQRKGLSQNFIDQVLKQIQDEAKHFNIDITNELKIKLYELATTDNESGNKESHKQKKDKKKPAQAEKPADTEAVQKCVDLIKERIEYFFKYKNRDDRSRAPYYMKYFSAHAKDVNTTNKKIASFSYHSYFGTLDPKDQRVQLCQGLEPIDKQQTYFTVKPQLQFEDANFSIFLDFLVKSDQSHIALASPQVERALAKFYYLLDHEKILKIMEKNVLENIFRNKDQIKYTNVEKLVKDLINSDNPNISQEFCAMDFKVVQRIAKGVEDIVTKISEDMEPYCLRVSEHGRDCLHQITQTQIVRIMQEVIRLTEHAPLFTLIQTKKNQRELFIAKLTSNDRQMDVKLAERTGKHLAQIIIKEIKGEQIQAFQQKIQGEQNLFKLKTIVSKIESQIESIVDGDLPDQFEIDCQDEEQESWWSKCLKLIGFGGDHQEEKKEGFINKMSKFKKVDAKFDFTPEEIIMFYVQPSEFLKNQFKGQWTKVTDVEFKRAKTTYAARLQQIKLNYQLYFESFLKKIESKKIQLATNVFIPEGQDKASTQEFESQIFKVACHKAMAKYMGLVVSKQWKNGAQIQVDEHTKMIHPDTMSLVTHDDIGIELLYASDLQKDIENETISNIENFIKSLMSEMEIGLDPEGSPQASLQFKELIGNFQQEMETKTLGCDQMCPLCRRQCDKVHDSEGLEGRIHSCESGHQIQGFGGNKHKMDNYAITFGCHELDEKDIVSWNGNDLKWAKFKDLIFSERKWSLDDQDGAKQGVKEKNVKIWNKIGPFICEYYREVKKIDIQFQKADAASKKIGSMQRIHYILMLDNSSSMDCVDSNGQSRWSNLSAAVSAFIAKFNASLKNNSKVSIITYSHTAKVEVEAQVPTLAMVKALDPPNGGTDFDPPLSLARGLMDKYQNNFDSFVLVMMSDGEASYPQEGVEDILKSPAKGKLRFKSIAYGNGSDSDSLTMMAVELGGTSDKILEPSQLSNAFIQMIPNLYGAQ